MRPLHDIALRFTVCVHSLPLQERVKIVDTKTQRAAAVGVLLDFFSIGALAVSSLQFQTGAQQPLFHRPRSLMHAWGSSCAFAHHAASGSLGMLRLRSHSCASAQYGAVCADSAAFIGAVKELAGEGTGINVVDKAAQVITSRKVVHCIRACPTWSP